MRYTRAAKFRKNKRLIITVKVFVIIYALIFSTSLIVSGTEGHFNDNEQISSTFTTASDWWDRSDLHFPNRGTQVIKECPPAEISVSIENRGLSMTKGTEYEVYYSEKSGNPQKDGAKIFEGIINPIEKGKSMNLTHLAENEGWYVFKVQQRLGYKDDYENRYEVWSEKIKVECKQPTVTTDEENTVKEETKTAEEPQEQGKEDKTVIEEQQESDESDNGTKADSEKQTDQDETKPVIEEKEQNQTESKQINDETKVSNDNGNIAESQDGEES